jgi:hypothetical protein
METKPNAGQKPTPGTPSAFEHEDAAPLSLLKSGVILAVILIVVFVSMRFAFGVFTKMTPMGANAAPFEDSRVLPPRPRLQVEPQKEIHAYCDGQAAILNSYSWVDANAGIVRIPIDRAMQLTLKQGLPTRAGGTVPADASGAAPAPLVPAEGVGGQCGYLYEADEKQKELQQDIEEEAQKAKHE